MDTGDAEFLSFNEPPNKADHLPSSPVVRSKYKVCMYLLARGRISYSTCSGGLEVQEIDLDHGRGVYIHRKGHPSAFDVSNLIAVHCRSSSAVAWMTSEGQLSPAHAIFITSHGGCQKCTMAWPALRFFVPGRSVDSPLRSWTLLTFY